MKKILGSLFLLLFIATNWASAQCPGPNPASPEPICIRTLDDGTIEVQYDLGPLQAIATPADIAEIRLERSNNGTTGWTSVATVAVGPAAWPAAPNQLTDASPGPTPPAVNGNNNVYFYRFVAVCNGPPQTDLDPSSPIKNILLNHTLANDFDVTLYWNWDTLSSGLAVTVNRKLPYTAAAWNARAFPAYLQGPMTFNETVDVCDDSVAYQIRTVNPPPVNCVSQSNTRIFRVQDLTPPDKPKIDTVSFDPITNRPLIAWNNNAKTDTWGYVVLFHPSNDCGTARLVDTVYAPTTRAVDLNQYIGTQPGQYSVYAFDGCVPGDSSISQSSTCVNSIFLDATVEVCDKTVQLNWTPYNGFSSSDVLYKVYVSVSGSAFLFIGQTKDQTFVHDNPVQNQTLRYKVVAFANGGAGPKTASSNRINIASDFLRFPDFQYLRYADVHDENNVRLELYTDATNDVAKYVLKRSLDTNDVFNTVNVFNAPDFKIPIDSITLLSDLSPLTDRHQYFYRVDMFDSCGSYMTTSNYTSTIYLRVQPDQVRRVNRLEWTNVFGWDGGVFSYKIYRFLDGEPLRDPQTVFPDSAPTTVFYDSLLLISDNITSGNPSQGEYCYIVEGIENEPTFRSMPPATARSNEVCVVQEPYISNPNAFTPNGDGKNERFKPILIYHDISSYEFYVMNRYGEIVYQTNNVKASWDGTYNGKDVPQGVYVYSVKYRSSTGASFEDRGTISVVR